MHLKHGSVLQGGKYKIEKLLGQGGFGITYLAVQTGLDRKVAIKEFFMKEHCNRDEDTSRVSVPSVGSRELVAKFRNKFLKEAQMISGYKHPNIVIIHDVFEENGTAYYVMEYHGGGSLSSLSLPLNSEEASVYIRQVASALSYLHDHNTMHLDVKPSNVLIDSDGNAVLIDFGVSKRYDQAGNQTSSTPVGISHGYAPGEQYQQGTLAFSPSTDIYALGATFYKLVTGDTPPDQNEVNENGLPPFPATVPASNAALIKKSMQPRRKDRPQSMTEFLNLLDEAYMQASNESSSGEVVDDGQTQIYSENPQQQGGSSVNDENNHDTGNETIVQGDDKPEMQEQKPQKKSRRWLWWLLAAVILAGVVVFAVMPSKTGGRAKQSEKNELTPLEDDWDLRETVASEATIPSEHGRSLTGTHEGHEWVDLGLSVKWATCNVGASSPGDYGNYYEWGETKTKSSYTEDNCASYGKSWGDIGGNSSRDAARANCGGNWRMPTMSELEELQNNCTWTWTTQNGHKGYKVTSKKNGQSIFLPAAGYRYGGKLYDDGGYGNYWSSTPYESNTNFAYELYFSEGHQDVDWFSRRYGRSVRPVLGD